MDTRDSTISRFLRWGVLISRAIFQRWGKESSRYYHRWATVESGRPLVHREDSRETQLPKSKLFEIPWNGRPGSKKALEQDNEREREERVEIPLGWQERSSNERRIPVARAQRHRLKGKGFPRAALSRIKRTPPSFLLFFPLRRATVKPSFFPKKRHQTPRGSLLCATELFFAKNGATVPRFLIPSFVPSLQSLLGPLSRESRDN